MSILAQLRAGLDLAWDALGDAKTTVTYHAISRGALNPSTGAVSQTTTQTTIDVGLVDYSAAQRAGTDIRSGDRCALIRAKDLAVRPQTGDFIVEADGTKWAVVGVKGHPGVYYDLQLRT